MESVNDVKNGANLGIDAVAVDVENSQPSKDTDEPFKVPEIPSQTNSSSENKQKIDPTDRKLPDELEVQSEKKLSSATVLSLSELKSYALSKISPAELLKEPNLSSVTYREPLWSGLLADEYWIETIKNGVVIEKFKLDKAMASVGRSKHADIILEHPSISRIHAVFQMRPVHGSSGDEEPGLYLFDIGSTHGTFLNKQRVEANCYNRVKVGHVIKFGSSTRLFIVHGPDSDAPAASPYTITEIKERNAEIRRKQQEMVEERKRQLEEKRKREAESGVNWGFKEDAEQESDEDGDDDENGPKSVNPFSMPEELQLEDPKKTLKGCFEREGFELDYICEEGFGTHICKIELPMVDSEDGRPVFAEVVNKGKKKDIQVQCALEACRILDAHGILRASSHERHEVKKRNWAENDYYDSDDDTYLDRTGSVEAKRKRRMERLGAEDDNSETGDRDKTHTFESLSADLISAQEELSKLEQRIKASQSHVAKMTSLDSLDEYMQGMKSGQEIDATTRRKMKMRTIELKKEIAKIEKMKEAAKPAEIKLKSSNNNSSGIMKSKSHFSGVTSRFGFSMKGNKSKPDVATIATNSENVDSMATVTEVNPLISGAGGNSVESVHSEYVVKENEDGIEYEDSNSDIEEKEINKTNQSTTDGNNCTKNRPSQGTHQTAKQSSLISNSLAFTLEAAKKLSHDSEDELEKSFHQTEKQNDKSSNSRVHAIKESTVKPKSVQGSTSVISSGTNTMLKEGTQGKGRIIVPDDDGKEEEDLTEGESFSGWVPPSDQQGDGKTALNSLLGY